MAGYLFKVSDVQCPGKVTKQTCGALSTAEAEYVALSAAAQEFIWLKQLTSELTTLSDAPTVCVRESN